MKSRIRRGNKLVLALLAGLIPAIILFGPYLGLSQAWVVVLSIVTALVWGWLAIWTHANAKADGSEWWQDDSASGWRGY
ncbi:MAG: hypothetical protein KC441_00740 [Anaerolineales bacterium]|nr:hypothetical protein [Anaerolineales bacterium]